jgi:hypothetical protein
MHDFPDVTIIASVFLWIVIQLKLEHMRGGVDAGAIPPTLVRLCPPMRQVDEDLSCELQ